MSWPEDMDWICFGEILKFCFFFLFWELKLFHDSLYIQRQTQSGGGHTFSEFACLSLSIVKPWTIYLMR